jgi:hypothetical protein
MYFSKQCINTILILLSITNGRTALEVETNSQPVPPDVIEATLNLESSGAGNASPDSESGNVSSGGVDGDHHCVWYDKCGPDPEFQDNVHTLNCVYEGKAGEHLRLPSIALYYWFSTMFTSSDILIMEWKF